MVIDASNKAALDALADIADFRTAVTDDTVITGLPADTEFKGNVGSIVMADGVSGNATIGSSATLDHAVAVSGSEDGQRQFVSGKDGSLRGADVVSGGSLSLENGGHIGEINLAEGSADDQTILTVNQRDPSKDFASGDNGITYIDSINGGANTVFNNHDDTHVTKGNVTVEDLNNSSNLVNGLK